MKMNSSPAYRSVVLDCLRENARNMREDHRDLARRISIALEHSRANLLNIEKINLELQKMKITVNDAMENISGTKGSEHTKVICENVLSNLINSAVEGYNWMTQSDVKEALSNVLGPTASTEEVSFDAAKSLQEAYLRDDELNSKELTPKFKLKNDNKAAKE